MPLARTFKGGRRYFLLINSRPLALPRPSEAESSRRLNANETGSFVNARKTESVAAKGKKNERGLRDRD
jgi:hypothetical protein